MSGYLDFLRQSESPGWAGLDEFQELLRKYYEQNELRVWSHSRAECSAEPTTADLANNRSQQGAVPVTDGKESQPLEQRAGGPDSNRCSPEQRMGQLNGERGGGTVLHAVRNADPNRLSPEEEQRNERAREMHFDLSANT